MGRKRLIAVLLVLACVVLAVEFIPGTFARDWIGGYYLTVHLDTPTGPPSVVICSASGRWDRAEEVAANLRMLPPEIRLSESLDIDGPEALADPFVGGPLEVRIRASGRGSLFGREVSRYQDRFLVVGAEWPGGRRVWKVVEIPDGRVSQEVRVSLP
jgi:hypothetical protein